MEPVVGIEPTTSFLPRTRSTTELYGRVLGPVINGTSEHRLMSQRTCTESLIMVCAYLSPYCYSVPKGTRTPDLHVRSVALYPTEL